LHTLFGLEHDFIDYQEDMIKNPVNPSIPESCSRKDYNNLTEKWN